MEKPPMLSKPHDRSFEAFKEWLTQFDHHTDPEAEDHLSEEELRKAWRIFWSGQEEGGE
jgi:hypothetical protein